jgi:lactate dehydrogenase-like 2-hydroxyacid dehydrogenase
MDSLLLNPSQKLIIVRLDSIHTPPPHFKPSFLAQASYTEHVSTPTDPAVIISRLTTPPATVVITTRVPLTLPILTAWHTAYPGPKFISVLSIGTDHIDMLAAKSLGIRVCNVPAASNESVAEHAIGFYFALRRNVVKMHGLVVGGVEWVKRWSLKDEFPFGAPRTAKEEVVGIIGGGELGMFFTFFMFWALV